MVGWCHRLNGHEFEQTLGDGEGQGSLACCSPRGHKESDTTYRLDNDNNSSRVQAAKPRGGSSLCAMWLVTEEFRGMSCVDLPSGRVNEKVLLRYKPYHLSLCCFIFFFQFPWVYLEPSCLF